MDPNRRKRIGAREQEETFVTFEAPKRRSCDRIAVADGRRRAAARRAAAELAAHRRRLLDLSATPDPDSDPTAALLLRVEPARAAAAPNPLLLLAEAALGSPR